MRFTLFNINIAFIGLAVTSASGGDEMDAVRSPTVWEAPAHAQNTLSNPTSRRVTTTTTTTNARTWNSPWGGDWGPSPTKKPTHRPVNVNAWGSSWGGNSPSHWDWDWVLHGWKWNGNAWANDAWTGDGWSWSPKTPTMSPMSAPPTALPIPEPTNSPTPATPNSSLNPTPVPTPLSTPTPEPSNSPTPAKHTTEPTNSPTPAAPNSTPTSNPTASAVPTLDPTLQTSSEPSSEPSSSLMPSPGPSSSLTCVEAPDSLVTNQFFPYSLLVLDNVTEWPPKCGLGNTTDECKSAVCAGLQNAAQEYLCEGLSCCKLNVICDPQAVVQTNNGLTERFLATSTVSFPYRISFTIKCLTQPCSSDDVAQVTEAAAAFAALQGKLKAGTPLTYEAVQQEIQGYLALLPNTTDTMNATNYFTNTFSFAYNPFESKLVGNATITPIPANTGPFELVGTDDCLDSVGKLYGYLAYNITNVADCALKCVDPACAIQENYIVVGMQFISDPVFGRCECVVDDIPNDPKDSTWPQDRGGACDELTDGENDEGFGSVAGSIGNPDTSRQCFRKIG